MASKVTAKCIECGEEFKYYFGVIEELQPISLFLEAFKKDQKNYFDKKLFFEYLDNNLKDEKDYSSQNEEGKLKRCELIFAYINEFFSPDEIEMLKTNILLNFKIEIYPYVNIEEEKEKRKILNLPLLSLKLLGKDEYTRKYSTMAYTNFSDDQQFLTCPKDLKLSCKFVTEEQI
ncbi:hypothetical protein [Mycoplasma crocodyli]|uniref:Uncharacterized protein n=1 Tax=Mycoplasma crocodyli (strain ATCC 51981 / MP145) TaxID=512564 RepID=D5E694_MYCCM|nr:hypothetical protein [Mycoplasma crocodyli]ADE19716.1 conserved hypothetical protein [Mycoplasma crocodyli MP145]